MEKNLANKYLVSRCLCAAIIAMYGLNCSPMDTYYKDNAESMFDKVWSMYRVPEHRLFSEYYPQAHEQGLTYFNDGIKSSQEVSFLWPFSGVASSAILLAEHNKAYAPYVDSVVVALEMYRDTTRVPMGYQAYPVKFGKVDRYYDDNGLVGIDYIDAYAVTKNPLYLNRAKEVMEFIMSGWSDDWGGGVTWLEGVRDQKPACSNGKAMVLALKLYDATNDRAYLDLGQRFFCWIDSYLVNDSLNIVHNSWFTKSGEIDKPFYTYNTGTLIQGACRLYGITGDDAYLQKAQQLSEGSYDYFFKNRKNGPKYINDLPWFNLVLMRGYQELFDIDKNPKYMDAMVESFDYTYNNLKDSHGLYPKDWSGNSQLKTEPRWLLDEACIPEFLIRISIYKSKSKI